MGINLAAFMADYYLFYYEFTFVKQLVDLIDTCPPATQLEPVRMLIICSIAPSNSDPAMAEYYGDAAVHWLSCFRSTVLYMDDLTSGPNPWLARLLHQSQFA
jgi:hypothetical protein